MKLIELLNEAKFSKDKQLVYHATYPKNLESIIKNGLIVNKNKDGYGSNQNNGTFGQSLDPLQSIYLTQNYNSAISIGQGMAENPLIVAVEIQPKMQFADEDNIFDILGMSESEILRLIKSVRMDIKSLSDMNDEQVINAVLPILKPKIQQYINSLPKLKNVSEKIKSMLIPQLNDMLLEICTSRILDNTPDIRKYQDSITRLLKQNIGSGNNLRISSDIGFSGANRIVGLLFPDRDMMWWNSSKTCPMHGWPREFKTPLELLKATKK